MIFQLATAKKLQKIMVKEGLTCIMNHSWMLNSIYISTCVKLMNLLINHVILNYENDKICNNYIIIQYTITES